MKVLMFSPAFYPSIGGLEAVVAMIAEGLSNLDCKVKVVTTTFGSGDDSAFPYKVIRSPSVSELLALTRWCDVFFHHNVSLKGIWPLLFVRRPWVVAHHGWYTRTDGALGWQDSLKRFVTRFATNIAVSQAVAAHLPVDCTVIPNPFRDDLFRLVPDVARDRELVFLGRFVSDKGCDLLLEALAILAAQGMRPALTVIGSGPEEANLIKQSHDLGITDQIVFAGKKSGEELVNLLNQHAIMIIPSKVQEGFGIVALEGIACGCHVIASSGGGLPEAIGDCGVTFPNGDPQVLASRIADALQHPEKLERYRMNAAIHLARHNRAVVSRAYYDLLSQVMSVRSQGAGA